MKILIINSKGHWVHGWFSSLPDLQKGMDVLNQAGFQVESIEVETPQELEKVLDQVSPNTLIWPNAYFVNKLSGDPAWMNEFIEERGLKFIGSRKETLQWVLDKATCQKILAEKNLPIPNFTIITRQNIFEIENLISERKLDFPLVLKPTSESGSLGVCMANNQDELKKQSRRILNQFPNSNVIIEEFLSSDDITCGFLQLGKKFILLPTYYIVKSAAGKNNVLKREVRLRLWDNVDKMQLPVTDPSIISQLKKKIPKIARALNITGVTRIDGRLDKNGQLRFFDVNGLPALCYPEGVLVKQCITCFPDHHPHTVFRGLIHTIVYHTLLGYGMEIPNAIKNHNLFTMQSDLVYAGELNEQEIVKENLLSII